MLQHTDERGEEEGGWGSSKLFKMSSLKILYKFFEGFGNIYPNISVGIEMLNFVKNKVW